MRGIYCIHCTVSSKGYVGQGMNVFKRLDYHFRRLRLGKHKNSHLQAAFNKYGESAFIATVLEFCSAEDLTMNEQKWIDYFDLANLYNMCPASESRRGSQHSIESRERMSIAQRSKKMPPVSEETKQKMSAAQRGRKKSPEQIKKLTIAYRQEHLIKKGL